MDNSMVIKLTKPIKFGEETISELKLREPEGKDFRQIESVKPFAMVLDLAAILSGVPASVIDRLNAADTMAVMDKVGGFLPDSQKTGAT